MAKTFITRRSQNKRGAIKIKVMAKGRGKATQGKGKPSFKTNVNLGLGFPKKVTMTHRYEQVISLVSTSGVPASIAFGTNCLFSPYIVGPGTGHQPYYFDQISALYTDYCVIGAKITFKIIPAAANSVPYVIGSWIDDNTSGVPTAANIPAEFQTGKINLVPSQTARELIYTHKWSARKYFGKGVLANVDLQGNSGANPTESSYFRLLLQCPDQTNTVGVFVSATIEYIAVWKEIKDVNQS